MQITLKGIIWGAVGTIATTVLGKIVESVFDVSLISPAIRTLLGWIQGLWGWLGSDVVLALWLVLLLSLMGVSLLAVAGVLVYVKYFEKGEQEAPKGVLLTADQLTAFMAIGKAIQEGQMLSGDDVRRKTGLSRIATDVALDHLYGIGLIEPHHGAYYKKYAGLTHTGRAYYLEIESLKA